LAGDAAAFGAAFGAAAAFGFAAALAFVSVLATAFFAGAFFAGAFTGFFSFSMLIARSPRLISRHHRAGRFF
jgi:hypothetical protein